MSKEQRQHADVAPAATATALAHGIPSRGDTAIGGTFAIGSNPAARYWICGPAPRGFNFARGLFWSNSPLDRRRSGYVPCRVQDFMVT